MAAAQQQQQGVQVSVNDLLALLGQKEVELAAARGQNAALTARVAELEKKAEKPKK